MHWWPRACPRSRPPCAGSRWCELAVGVVVVVLLVVGLACLAGPAQPAARCGEVERTAGAIAARRPVPPCPRARTRAPRWAGWRWPSTPCSTGSRRRSTPRRRPRRRPGSPSARMRRFVADASHELRTPLTSIRGFAELYRQGAVRRRGRRRPGHGPHRGRGHPDGPARRRHAAAGPAATSSGRWRTTRSTCWSLATDAVHDARASAPDRTVDLQSSTGQRAPGRPGRRAQPAAGGGQPGRQRAASTPRPAPR